MRAFSNALLGTAAVLSSFIPLVSALGSQCSAAVTAGTAAPGDAFWMENIKHQGLPAFNANATSVSEYAVFRNVLDYGAKGDGLTDDTSAINLAFAANGTCGNLTCGSTTNAPAVVYFPPGEYRVTEPIQVYYYTQMIGDARNPPTLIADKNFSGIAVVDADPYSSDGENWYTNQDSFYRSVRNFIIDLTAVPANVSGTGLHWQVSQSTSLMNIVVNMNSDPNTTHQGIYMEDGSGGFMGDLVFNGGKYGIWVGNQQFTVRNITVNGAQNGVYGSWAWGWTFQGVTFNDCEIGFNISSTTNISQGFAAASIIDAYASNTDVFVMNSNSSNGTLTGSLVLNNIQLQNVSKAVAVLNGDTVLEGGDTTITHWVQGNVYQGDSSTGTFVQDYQEQPVKAGVLLNDQGRIVGKTHPQYADYAVDQFVSVKDQGAVGDGYTDDTIALQNVLDAYSGCKIIFFDQGTYLVSSTLTIPAGTQMVGEAWSVIMGGGSAFEDSSNPLPVVKVGEAWSTGTLEITDIVFTTRGPAAGAIVVEWNVHDPAGYQAAAGMWDSHIRLGGADGTDLEGTVCGEDAAYNSSCAAAFMALHLTQGASAYLEGTWVWSADHTLDSPYNSTQAYSARGVYSESEGPVWMIGTASEHHVLYQYNLVGASNHYIGLLQTETPYYEPDSNITSNYPANSAYNDPTSLGNDTMAWAFIASSSQDILVYGAGSYSFFDEWNSTCSSDDTCQTQLFDVQSGSGVYIYNLVTVGTRYSFSYNEQGLVQSTNGNVNNTDGYSSCVSAWTPW